MTTELTIGSIDPGYGGLPIGVAAALGGATLAWHAHPGQRMGLLYSGTVPLQAAHAAAVALTHMDDK